MKRLMKQFFLLLFACSIIEFTSAVEDEHGFIVLQLDKELAFDETSNRIQTKILHGNPSAEGLYIMRIRFPAGASSSPHSHDKDRFITVIEGIWYAGTDDSHNMDKTVAIPAGGFMKHPAGAIHYDGAKSSAVVVEIRGMGPVKTTRVKKLN